MCVIFAHTWIQTGYSRPKSVRIHVDPDPKQCLNLNSTVNLSLCRQSLTKNTGNYNDCPRVVSLFPLWVAPNLITIIGLAINILTALVLMISCPTATERPPWWATLQCAAGLFLYQTLGEFLLPTQGLRIHIHLVQIQHFRLNIDPYPRFDDQKLENFYS
jgi:hypothetical protein